MNVIDHAENHFRLVGVVVETTAGLPEAPNQALPMLDRDDERAPA